MSIFKKPKKEKKEEIKEIKEQSTELPKISIHPKSASLIKQAWITEKAGDLSGLGKYVFVVDKKAGKTEIKKAIESIYGVKAKDVNVINIKGKAKRLGRSLGKTSALKKGIVTLKEGEKIDIMPT